MRTSASRSSSNEKHVRANTYNKQQKQNLVKVLPDSRRLPTRRPHKRPKSETLRIGSPRGLECRSSSRGRSIGMCVAKRKGAQRESEQRCENEDEDSKGSIAFVEQFQVNDR